MITQPWEHDADAVAHEFMTAGGLNTPEQIADMLARCGDSNPAASFAQEAAECWTLHVSVDDLEAAIARLIADHI